MARRNRTDPADFAGYISFRVLMVIRPDRVGPPKWRVDRRDSGHAPELRTNAALLTATVEEVTPWQRLAAVPAAVRALARPLAEWPLNMRRRSTASRSAAPSSSSLSWP